VRRVDNSVARAAARAAATIAGDNAPSTLSAATAIACPPTTAARAAGSNECRTDLARNSRDDRRYSASNAPAGSDLKIKVSKKALSARTCSTNSASLLAPSLADSRRRRAGVLAGRALAR
jgi:hypothetical protein